MEYIEGVTLRQRLAPGPLKIREGLDIAIQVASALVAAHNRGIIHRDIKPENVIVRPDGLVKVLDFGVAKLAAAPGAVESTQTAFHTSMGAVLGTAAYMSPEQARGQVVDARTDVWALGVVLYEMMAGRPPFAGRSISELLAGILEHEPAPVTRFHPDVPVELQRIVVKTLRKDPEQRYQVMKDLLLDLQALRDEVPVSTLSQLRETGRAVGIRRRIAPITLIVVALAATVAAVLWWSRNRLLAPPAVPAPVGRPLTRLTFDTGLQIDAAFSPDGRSIAYASDRGGNFDIWVQSIGQDDARQITSSPGQDTQPAWSPDGRSIVFRSGRDGGGLFIVPVRGGAERQLTSFGVRPQWVSGGSEIFFRTGVADVYRSVHIVSSDGATEPRQLLQDFLLDGTWWWMAPHPDGRVSVMGVHPARGFGFFTVSLDSRNVTASKIPKSLPLHFGQEGTRVTRFQWDRDGHALYIEAITNQVSNIWKVGVEPTTLEWVSADRLTTGTSSDVSLALSPDGTRLAYTSQRESIRLWTFPFDPVAGRITGKGTPITPEDGNPGNFGLTRDGRKVAYTMSRAGTRRVDLWMTNLDTGATAIISEGQFGGAWSPDSAAIAYAIRRPDSPDPGEWAVAVRQVPGPERLIASWSNRHVFLPSDWTSDGQAVLGSWVMPLYGASKLALWRQALPPSDAPERILLADPRKKLWGATFSPDSRWITFVAEPVDDLRHLEIGVAPAAGSSRGEWTRIVSGHAWPDKPRWSPDSRTLYFISRHDTSFYNLWGIRFDSERGTAVGEPFVISHFDSPGFRISPITTRMEIGISATRAVITMMEANGNIWMLENIDR